MGPFERGTAKSAKPGAWVDGGGVTKGGAPAQGKQRRQEKSQVPGPISKHAPNS